METTWAFESSMDQLDSMSARGYGVKKRTHFHLFIWERKDWIHIAEIVILMIRRRERKVGFIGQISFVLKNLKRINSSNVTINILCTYFGSIVDDRMPERASGRRYFR